MEIITKVTIEDMAPIHATLQSVRNWYEPEPINPSGWELGAINAAYMKSATAKLTSK